MKRQLVKILYTIQIQFICICMILFSVHIPQSMAEADIDIRATARGGNIEFGDGAESGANNPMEPASKVLTYVHPNSNYTMPLDPHHSPNTDLSWTGRNAGERCNFAAQKEKPCNGDMECAEEFLGAKWTDAPKKCYFYNSPCQGTDISPRQKCHQECNPDLENCNNKCNQPSISDKCTYETDCLYSYFVPFSGKTQGVIQPCTHHSQCSSGYCEEMKDLQGKVVQGQTLPNDFKVCMPYSKCVVACVESGQKITTNDGVCCTGLVLSNDGTKTCINPALTVPPPPESFGTQVNMSTCEGRIWEVVDGQDVKDAAGNIDYNIAPNKYFTFTRYLYGVEWLWKNSERSGYGENSGKWDFFNFNTLAKDFGKTLYEARLPVENSYIKYLEDQKARRQQLLTMEKDKNKGASERERIISEGAAGVVFYQLMSEENIALAPIHGEKAAALGEIIEPLEMLKLATERPHIHNDDDKYRYNWYGENKNVLYCKFWPPHCWLSENICGTYLQKNKECVNEAWNVNGAKDVIGSNGKILLDPIYPKVLAEGGGVSFHEAFEKHMKKVAWGIFKMTGQAIKAVISPVFAEDDDDAGSDQTVETVAAAILLPFAPVMFLVIGIAAIFSFFFGQWEPKKYDWYNGKMEKLYKAIKKYLTEYANLPLDSSNSTQKQYNKDNGVKNIPEMVTKPELKMKIKQVSPQMSDEQMNALLDQVDVPTMRELGLQLVSEFARIHLLSYSLKTSDKYQYTDERTSRATAISNMIQYLVKYHGAAAQLHAEIGSCFMLKASQIGSGFGEAPPMLGVNGQPIAPTPIDPNSVATADVAVPDVKIENCTGTDCMPSTDIGFGDFKNIDVKGNLGAGSKWKTISDGKGRDLGNAKDLKGSASWKDKQAARDRDLASRRADFLKKRGLKDPGELKSASSAIFDELKGVDGAKSMVGRLNEILSSRSNGSLLLPIDTSSSSNGSTGSGSGEGAIDYDAERLARMKNKGDGSGSGDGKKDLEIKWDDDVFKSSKSSSGNLSAQDLARNKQLLDDLKRDKNKYKGNPDDTIWRKVTNAYILHGFPRLLQTKNKDSAEK